MQTTTTLYTYPTRALIGTPLRVAAGTPCEIVAIRTTDHGTQVAEVRIDGRYTRCAIHLIQGAA